MISIANDVQGPEVAAPWLDRAGVTFTRLTDEHNEVGNAYALKIVPIGILLDAEGRLVRPVGVVDIDDDTFRAELEAWASSGEIPAAWRQMAAASTRELSPAEAEADARLQLALVLLSRDKLDDALEQLRQAVICDPENWLIRKQMWAIETPSAFYDGPVDYDWQKQRKQEEDETLLAKESP